MLCKEPGAAPPIKPSTERASSEPASRKFSLTTSNSRPEQMQQVRRLLRHDIDVATEFQAGVLDAGDDGQRRGRGAADEAVRPVVAAHQLRGAHPDLLDRVVDRDSIERHFAGADLAQRIGKTVHRVAVIGQADGRRQKRQPAAANAGQMAHRLGREGVVVEVVVGVDQPHVGAAMRGEGDAALQHVAGPGSFGCVREMMTPSAEPVSTR